MKANYSIVYFWIESILCVTSYYILHTFVWGVVFLSYLRYMSIFLGVFIKAKIVLYDSFAFLMIGSKRGRSMWGIIMVVAMKF